MTNREAIDVIKNQECCFCNYGSYQNCHSDCNIREALDLAIKALEEREEMESAIDWWKDTNCVTVSAEPATEEDREKLKKLFQDPLPVEIDITEQYKRQLAILTANSLQRIIDPIVEALPRIIDSSISAIEKMSPEDLIRIVTEGEWIPVSERLPEEFQRVLVTIVNYNGNKVVRVSEYYNREGKGVFRIKENYEQWEVGEKGFLAWMPLPEAYKEEENEEGGKQ